MMSSPAYAADYGGGTGSGFEGGDVSGADFNPSDFGGGGFGGGGGFDGGEASSLPRVPRAKGFSARSGRICGSAGQACLMAEMSKVSFTLSLTITPPASSAAFQVRPQSERRISAEPSKPTRSLP